MPSLIGFKPGKDDQDIVDWLDSQKPTSASDLIRQGLRLLMSGGNPGGRKTVEPQPPGGIDAARFDRLLAALEKMVGIEPETANVVPTIHSNGHRKAAYMPPTPVEPEEATASDLERATGNFLSAFG
jgi:hypothetical protein